MKLDTFFIVNTFLLVVLVGGAMYLQSTQSAEVASDTSALRATSTSADTSTMVGWEVSTTTPAATPVTVAPTPAPTVAPATKPTTPVPTPVRRVYNDRERREDGGDDN